jgi:hypothetical protein
MGTGSSLLLYSLSEYRELVFELFRLAAVRAVVEVGAEAGAFTRELADWARASGGAVTCVDPVPSDALRALQATGAVRVVAGRSPGALASLPLADAYLLDGDHNYVTVRGELEAIDAARRSAGRDALVVLHDVGWPCARRDQYYDPASLPPGAVLPHSFERGVTPGEPGLVAGGFRGEGAFAFAEREGGPRNGVRTAVEDFLSARDGDDLVFLSCPLVFGAGFLFPRAAPWAAEAAALLRPFADEPLLARVEDNRLALYLRVLEDQQRLASAAADLEAERARRAAAEARLATIEASLSHRVAGRVQVLKERVAPPGTLRRSACDAAIAAMKRAR